MSTHKDRIDALRTQLGSQKLNGFVIPLTDEHMSEYVGAYAQRLAWLTGFEGSAGSAAVLADKAAIFVDGRYTLQVRDQVDGNLFSYQSIPDTNVADWLGGQMKAGDRIGYDPWLHTKGWVQSTAKALADKGAELVAIEENPIDRVWRDRPAPSPERLIPHPDSLAGQPSADKRRAIASFLKDRKADATVVAALDSIAWAFNVRGKDVSRTPVGLAFAIVRADATADLFVDPGKVDGGLRDHLGPDVTIRPRGDFADALEALGGTVVADPATCVAAIFESLNAGGAKIVEARDPCILPKAAKNAVEIEGSKAAHVRDGAALTRFLHWFDQEASKGGLDEMIAADRLEGFRRETNMLQDLSFDTISGAGPNGAIVHYRVSPETNRKIEQDSIFLIDSGAQYVDGTTDVTRTMIVGKPTAEMRDRFTRVLKGHIAVATAIFPKGTRGVQLDTLARASLWEVGLDYAHGTGHGVGSFLAVHEGPQRIALPGSGQTGGDEPLVEGMILSDEPGYYKTGEYGMRVENLILVVKADIPGAEKQMFRFETLTLAPIDLALVDVDLLTKKERDWLNAYHARVRDELSPLLPDDVQAWLVEATRPI
ncbi:aminopeptidase P family protein [Sphingoaurantiacus capsulatus]|uniref:Aminopeptidase P family protein n=1 Tax=Sphingoaurantiacus capsulatus TaxID=1771310 RepID=A0ABV7X7A9_9SPHN